MRKLTAVGVAAGLAVLLGASTCEESGQAQENTSRQGNYDRLVEAQPAQSMNFSPTRETKNFWIETWDEPGKVAYVYMQNANGDITGYYVFEGLPVSYCTSLIPPYQIDSSGNGKVVIPAPSIDGTFASSSNCNAFYGKDAVTGGYMEYTVGMGNNPMIFDQPVQRQAFAESQPLGYSTLEDVEESGDDE